MESTRTLLNKMTVENVNKKIEDGWSSSVFIAKYIVGIDTWRSLSIDDQKLLVSRVNRILKENKPLIYE